MDVFLLVVAAAFGAICVCLTVRFVNRRERWAKRALAAVLGLPVLYAASFGPACWLASRHDASRAVFRDTYLPLGRIANRWQPALDGLRWYGSAGMPKDRSLTWAIERNKAHGEYVVIFAR